MARLIIPYDAVWVFNEPLLHWLGETKDSWFQFFLETFIHHDGGDLVLREYFDAIFSETDWEWANRNPSPFPDLITGIVEDYRQFRQRIIPFLGFIQYPPVGYVIDFYTIEFLRVGILFSVYLREVPHGPTAV